MTPARTYHDPDTRQRLPRDVGLPLPSVTVKRHEIAAGDVTPLMLGYRANGLEDRAICRVLAVYSAWVIVQRKDNGAWVWVNKQRQWEVIDKKEWEE